MTDPVEALAAALRGTSPWSDDDAFADVWVRHAQEYIAALRASGFDVVPTAHPDDGHEHSWGCRLCSVDVVPTGDAGLDAGVLRDAIVDVEAGYIQTPDRTTLAYAGRVAKRYAALREYARLSSSDTDR